MGRVIRWGGLLLAAALVLGMVIDFLLGPWEPVDLSWRDPGVPELSALEPWLAEREAKVPNLREGAQKQILWAGEPGVQTPISIVYIHGFSAAAPEMRPVPDAFAEALGANLHFTRLSGHGRDAAAMGEPSVRDWADDLAEAIEVGRRLGERVILLASSMGGALATQAALDPAYSADVAGIALFAPAYRLRGIGGKVLTLPFARQWGPALIGESRTVTPRSPEHQAQWSLTYPTVALLPLGALVRSVGQADKSAATLPALFFFADADQVIDPGAVRAAASDWGAPSELAPLVMGEGDDPGAHVIAGDILSPGQHEIVLRRLLAWSRGLTR